MLVAIVSALLMAGDASAPAPATAPVPPADPMDKIVCRRLVETGSLIRARRECHTKRQWASIDDQNQFSARDIVDDGRSKGSGGN